MNKNDFLVRQWNQQEDFMHLLQKTRNFPQYPVDISSKQGQKIIKEAVVEAQSELYEAIQHLKNTKSHRIVDLPEVNLDEYIEEIVDAQKYIIEALILAGVTFEKYCEIFEKKTNKNIARIEEGY